MENKLRLSSRDKKIAGVCGGIAEFFKLDSTLVRIAWVILTMLLQGVPLLVYIVCWAVMPMNTDV